MRRLAGVEIHMYWRLRGCLRNGRGAVVLGFRADHMAGYFRTYSTIPLTVKLSAKLPSLERSPFDTGFNDSTWGKLRCRFCKGVDTVKQPITRISQTDSLVGIRYSLVHSSTSLSDSSTLGASGTDFISALPPVSEVDVALLLTLVVVHESGVRA